MTDLDAKKAESRLSGGTLIRIGAIAASGIAINWISELFQPGPFIVLILVVLALALLVAADSPRTTFTIPFLGKVDRDLIKFGIASLLVGTVLAGLWQIPLFPSQRVPLDWLVSTFGAGNSSISHNYELGALACIGVLGAIAVFRRAPWMQVIVFGIASIAGNSLVLGVIDPGEQPLPTLIGWSIAYVIVVVVLLTLSDMLRLFGSFFGLGRGKASPASTTTSEESSTDTQVGE